MTDHLIADPQDSIMSEESTHGADPPPTRMPIGDEEDEPNIVRSLD